MIFHGLKHLSTEELKIFPEVLSNDMSNVLMIGMGSKGSTKILPKLLFL